MDIWEQIRYARDQALEAERTEREQLFEADTAELPQAASVKLATRQAVRDLSTTSSTRNQTPSSDPSSN
jgi:protein subunit release factor B